MQNAGIKNLRSPNYFIPKRWRPLVWHYVIYKRFNQRDAHINVDWRLHVNSLLHFIINETRPNHEVHGGSDYEIRKHMSFYFWSNMEQIKSAREFENKRNVAGIIKQDFYYLMNAVSKTLFW